MHVAIRHRSDIQQNLVIYKINIAFIQPDYELPSINMVMSIHNFSGKINETKYCA